MPMTAATETGFKEFDIWGRHISTRQIFLYQIFRKMRNGFSPIVGICGPQRGGKSFIGIWIAYILYQILGRELDPTKITFYEPMKAIADIENKERDVLFIDEASDVMDYQEWHKQTHRALRSMVNTQAYKNNLYIFISPFLPQIDKSLRIHCDFIVLVTERGSFKVWKYKKKYDAEKMDETTSRIFLDYVRLRMSAVPDDIWRRYLKFSIEEKEKIRKARLKTKEEIKNENAAQNNENAAQNINEHFIKRYGGDN